MLPDALENVDWVISILKARLKIKGSILFPDISAKVWRTIITLLSVE
jgi:hypothetical protein